MARPRVLQRPRTRSVNLDDFTDELLEQKAASDGVSVSQVIRDMAIHASQQAQATLIAQLRASEEATAAENRRIIREHQELQARMAAMAAELQAMQEAMERARVAAEKSRQESEARMALHSPHVDLDPAQRYAKLIAGFARQGWQERIRPLAAEEEAGRRPPDPTVASLKWARQHAGSWTQVLVDVEALA